MSTLASVFSVGPSRAAIAKAGVAYRPSVAVPVGQIRWGKVVAPGKRRRGMASRRRVKP